MAGPYGVYVTLEQLKLYLTSKQTTNRLFRDDDKLQGLNVRVSRILNGLCRRTFYPRYETRYYSHPKRATGQIEFTTGFLPYYSDLRVDDDLLEVSVLTTQNGEVTIPSSEYFLKTGQSYNTPPYSIIELSDDSTYNFTYTGTPQRANSVAGYWGFVPHWANAWAAIGSLANGVNTTITSFVMNENLEAEDEDGIAPAFQRQQLLKVGTEYVYCTGVDYKDQTLTVVRNVNGTTAASHLADATVYVFRPDPEVVEITLLLANYYYHRRDTVGRPEDRPIATPTGTILLSAVLPSEVTAFVNRYKKSWRANSWQ